MLDSFNNKIAKTAGPVEKKGPNEGGGGDYLQLSQSEILSFKILDFNLI